MTQYIRVGLVTEPADLRDQMIRDLQTRVPGWLVRLGSLDTGLLETQAVQNAALHEIASSVFDSIYRTLGASLYGIPPLEATYATGESTWTMRDNLGYLIPAGTEVKKEISGDEAVGFAVVEDVTVPPGNTVTGTGEVQLAALVEGAAGSGLSGAMSLVTPLDGPLPDGIELEALTQGGRDEEEDEDYLDRLTRRFRRLTFGIVLPVDAEEAARDIPGVARALAIDNFIPPADDTAPGALTIVAIDEFGEPVSGAVEDAVLAELQASVEQGFVFHVMEPTYTDVDVAFSFTVEPGADPGVVTTAAEAAVTAYVSPGTWGLPTGGDQALWLPRNKVRVYEVGTVLNGVDGLNEVESLAINGVADTDFTLAGTVARLPRPGTITGTAV